MLHYIILHLCIYKTALLSKATYSAFKVRTSLRIKPMTFAVLYQLSHMNIMM